MAEHAIKITEDNFEEKVIRSDKPFLIDFWAPWCHPCEIMSPIIEDLAEKIKKTAYVGKVDVDENPAIAERFDIQSIPTFILFDKGQVKKTSMGSLDKKRLLETFGKWFG